MTFLLLLALATAAVLAYRRRTSADWRPPTLITFRITVTAQSAADGSARREFTTRRVITVPSPLPDLARKTH